MRQFVVTRTTPDRSVRTVQVFAESDHLEAAVCLDLAREVEGLEAEIFLGADLVDVVRSHENFFAEAGR